MAIGLSDADRRRLIEAAASARARAWAPYSRFAVGAAIMTDDDRIFAGCNVENASYGLSMCAERNAVAAAVAAGSTRLRAVAVVAESTRPVAPCGACRQVLMEFGVQTVILAGPGHEPVCLALTDLLPWAFGPSDLG